MSGCERVYACKRKSKHVRHRVRERARESERKR